MSSESSFLVRSAIPLASLEKSTKYLLRFPFSAHLDTQSLTPSEKWPEGAVQSSASPGWGPGTLVLQGPQQAEVGTPPSTTAGLGQAQVWRDSSTEDRLRFCTLHTIVDVTTT